MRFSKKHQFASFKARSLSSANMVAMETLVIFNRRRLRHVDLGVQG